MRKFFIQLCSVLLVLFSFTCVASALDLKDLKITSNKSEYDKKTGYTTFSGDVIYELEGRKMHAKKLVVMVDSKGTIQKMRVDTGT